MFRQYSMLFEGEAKQYRKIRARVKAGIATPAEIEAFRLRQIARQERHNKEVLHTNIDGKVLPVIGNGLRYLTKVVPYSGKIVGRFLPTTDDINFKKKGLDATGRYRQRVIDTLNQYADSKNPDEKDSLLKQAFYTKPKYKAAMRRKSEEYKKQHRNEVTPQIIQQELNRWRREREVEKRIQQGLDQEKKNEEALDALQGQNNEEALDALQGQNNNNKKGPVKKHNNKKRKRYEKGAKSVVDSDEYDFMD